MLHIGGVSMKGLAKLIATLSGDNSQTAADSQRKELMVKNRELMNAIGCRDAFRTTTGTEWQWDYAEPGALLSLLVDSSDALQALYTDAWDRRPCSQQSPWSAVVGFDEFIPGNKLATDQTRKTMVVSFSFLELGGAALAQGMTWVTPVTVRSNKISQDGLCNLRACWHLGGTATSSLSCVSLPTSDFVASLCTFSAQRVRRSPLAPTSSWHVRPRCPAVLGSHIARLRAVGLT